MRKRDIVALVVSDPVNIRYATGARNRQIFCARNTPARYLILSERRNILFEFTGCEHLAAGLENVDEVRPSTTASFVAAGPTITAREKEWAADMVATLTEPVGPNATIGMERMNAATAIAKAPLGVRIVDAQEPIDRAATFENRAAQSICLRARRLWSIRSAFQGGDAAYSAFTDIRFLDQNLGRLAGSRRCTRSMR